MCYMATNDPIHGGFATPPKPLPQGIKFKHLVTIRQIDGRTARLIYENHHSYLPSERVGTHHGIYFRDNLVGAITYASYPSSATIDGYGSENIREVGRVCVGIDMANLASCAMSKSQDIFADNHPNTKLLVTFVREDYQGSMFAALKKKGWEHDRTSEGKQPGNSPNKDIYDWDKQRWICPINRDGE